MKLTSDHSRHIHKNVPYVGLLRAARLHSIIQDFDAERLNLEMILLLNGYPPKFISHPMKSFFHQVQCNVSVELTGYKCLSKMT